jgi:hypothetical protein
MKHHQHYQQQPRRRTKTYHGQNNHQTSSFSKIIKRLICHYDDKIQLSLDIP